MRVMIVAHGLFPGFLAPEAKEYGKHLTRLGVDVTVVCVGGRSGAQQNEHLGFAVHLIEPHGRLQTYLRLKELMSDVDLVHYLPGRGLELMPLLQRTAKYVFDQRSVSVTGSRVRDGLINFGKRLQPVFANHLIYTDLALARQLKPVRDLPTSLLPVGYPADLFYPCSPFKDSGIKPLLYQGAVRAQRRLEHLIELLARLPQEYTLTIVGGGSASDEAYRRNQLARLADSLGCADRLELTGGVPQPEVRKYIAASYLCLSYVPMIDAFQDQAVLKTLEYLACWRPVLASATRYTKQFCERFGNNRILLTDGTLDDMARKIIGAADYIEAFYRRENLNKLTNDLDCHSWEHQVKTRLLPIYKSILNSHNHRN